MELYLDLHSQPCRAVFLFARATGIPFKFQLVDLTKGKTAQTRPGGLRWTHMDSDGLRRTQMD
uniref:GST N-terminal domain-containing protein n=1 Tax=Sphaeramia orbicularis TaxID=375764 RepID=A0A672Z2D1_9TELE